MKLSYSLSQDLSVRDLEHSKINSDNFFSQFLPALLDT